MKQHESGIVHYVGPVETVGNKGFIKRIFVLKTGSVEWPQYLPFELHKDAVANVPKEGSIVNVEFYLQGRAWNDKYYLSAKCHKWTLAESAPSQPANQQAATQANPPAQKDDDLPF